jgi:hypothetical protein
METITKTTISRTKYYFIHYGKKSSLSHHPIDQFNGAKLRPSRGISDLPSKQRWLHKKLSQLPTSTSVYHAAELQERVMPQPEEESDSESIAAEEESQQSQYIFGDCIKLNATESPYLAKLFGEKAVYQKTS